MKIIVPNKGKWAQCNYVERKTVWGGGGDEKTIRDSFGDFDLAHCSQSHVCTCIAVLLEV